MLELRTVRGDLIKIDAPRSSLSVSNIRKYVASVLGVCVSELVIVLRDNNNSNNNNNNNNNSDEVVVWKDDDDDDVIVCEDSVKKQLLRVIHRPAAPLYIKLRVVGLVLFFSSTFYALGLDVSVMGILYSLLLSLLLRYLPRKGWLLAVSCNNNNDNNNNNNNGVVDTFENGSKLTRHLIAIPVYNESSEYLEPMLQSLLNVETSMPMTVLFAAEMKMEEQWLMRAKARLEKKGITVFIVRHPMKLLNEVPGAASNLNWALESFCFQAYEFLAIHTTNTDTNTNNNHNNSLFIHPNNYLLTKCDSNGVVDKTYLLEIERLSKTFQLNAKQRQRFFLQPPWRWTYTQGWNSTDAWVKSRISKTWDVGEGGLSHFSFPLSQFLELGRYSHSQLKVLDDTDCFLQQQQLGAQCVSTKQSVYKYHDGPSDMFRRMMDSWIPQVVGTAIVDFSMRRYLLYTFHFGATVLYLQPLAVFLKTAKMYYLCKTQQTTPLHIFTNTSNYFSTVHLLFVIFIHVVSAVLVHSKNINMRYQLTSNKLKYHPISKLN